MLSGECDHEGKYTIFGQSFKQLKPEYSSFKKNKVDQKAFNVSFFGEGSQDAGGPFRDCITNMCGELQSDCLPILIRTQNNKNDHGQFRDCWIPNGHSISFTHLEMFTYFGAMLGWALRSTSALNLDLPPLFWKKILNEPLGLSNLKEIDTFTWKMISDLQTQMESMTAEEFDSSVDQNFTTHLSNGTEVELCYKGREKRVTKANA